MYGFECIYMLINEAIILLLLVFYVWVYTLTLASRRLSSCLCRSLVNRMRSFVSPREVSRLILRSPVSELRKGSHKTQLFQHEA
jgi:hypothetical protein